MRGVRTNVELHEPTGSVRLQQLLCQQRYAERHHSNYFNAQPGNSGATVTAIGVEPASPLGFSTGVPDQRPIYPPNTGTLRYWSGSDSTYVGEKLRVDFMNNGAPKSGQFYDYVVAPLTCPSGFNVSSGCPLNPVPIAGSVGPVTDGTRGAMP